MEDTNVKEDFFNIKTRLAGMALQKFINYHVKVAVIIEDEEVYNYRFKEMIMEANKETILEPLRILQKPKVGF